MGVQSVQSILVRPDVARHLTVAATVADMAAGLGAVQSGGGILDVTSVLVSPPVEAKVQAAPATAPEASLLFAIGVDPSTEVLSVSIARIMCAITNGLDSREAVKAGALHSTGCKQPKSDGVGRTLAVGGVLGTELVLSVVYPLDELCRSVCAAGIDGVQVWSRDACSNIKSLRRDAIRRDDVGE